MRKIGGWIECVIGCAIGVAFLIAMATVFDAICYNQPSAKLVRTLGLTTPYTEKVHVVKSNFVPFVYDMRVGQINAIPENPGRMEVTVERTSGQQIVVCPDAKLTDTPTTATLIGYRYSWFGNTVTVFKEFKVGDQQLAMSQQTGF